MNNSQLMLAAINNGLHDDATTSAALDAIRDESGCSLLAAVLEVARIHNAARSAREITQAVRFLEEPSAIKEKLREEIAAECLHINPTGLFTFAVEEGDKWPRGADTSLYAEGVCVHSAHITVGARWVQRAANRLMIEADRKPATVRKPVAGQKRVSRRAAK